LTYTGIIVTYIMNSFKGGSSVKIVVIYWAYNSCISFKNNKIQKFKRPKRPFKIEA